ELTNNTLKIYPNPVSKDLNIEISANESIRSIEFFDITGSLQKTINNVNNNTINCSDFSDGIYFIRVLTDKGKVINEKVMVVH
ncbi:MAG: T9SS type A sorting domain-containing protein, partial [Bacteroidia bacterium]|nr:T9SS type A sorting domain-containing protein [Bacteroidia bacterium]